MKHKRSFILLLSVMIIISGAGIFALAKSNDYEIITPKSSYTVVNRWLNDRGRNTDLSKFSTNENTTFQLKTKGKTPEGSKLIFKTENMGVSVFTSGKMLYKSTDETGTRYNIIPLDDLKKNGTLYLHLYPNEKHTGSIKGTVKITTQNDFLLSLIFENCGIILSSFLLFLFSFLLTVYCLIKKKYNYLYLILFTFLTGMFILSSSDILQTIVGCATMRYALKYIALMLSPIPLFAFIGVSVKENSRPVDLLQYIILFYAILRITLFITLNLSFEKGIVVFYLLLVIQLVLCFQHLFGLYIQPLIRRLHNK